jgi:AcrR family transcriptional regulator
MPDDRRANLLAAAADVFTRRGVADATVAEITDLAGVAKGSFYREFESKDHIVVALQEQFVDELMERATAMTSQLGDGDLWELADRFLVELIDFELEHRDLAAVLAREAPAAGSEVFAAADRRLQELMATGIRLGVATGVFDVADPEMTAGLLMHGVHGVLRHAVLYEPTVDRDRIVESARELMRRVLART